MNRAEPLASRCSPGQRVCLRVQKVVAKEIPPSLWIAYAGGIRVVEAGRRCISDQNQELRAKLSGAAALSMFVGPGAAGKR